MEDIFLKIVEVAGEEGNLKVSLEGKADNDAELITDSINLLIRQLNFKSLFDDETEFLKEMGKLLGGIAEHCWNNGLFEELRANEKYFFESSGQLTLTEMGTEQIINKLLNFSTEQEFV